MSEPREFAAGAESGDTTVSHATAAPDSGLNSSPPAGGHSRVCVRCGEDLRRGAENARFCPRCGLSSGSYAQAPLPGTMTAGDASPASAALLPVITADPQARMQAWFRLRQARLGRIPSTTGTLAPGHSLMLHGYANAMYRLGWRYETGQGAGRNVEEAIRCYFKAAKLGNAAALARLAPQCVEGNAPTDPPPT